MKNLLQALLALALVGAGGKGYAQTAKIVSRPSPALLRHAPSRPEPAAPGDSPSAAVVLLQTPAYTVYADSVVQENGFASRVLSSTEMVSDYRSPAAQYKDARISFKFSINGKDNEMVSGSDHHFTCIGKNGVCVAPLIRFGTQLKEEPSVGPVYLAPDTRLTLRADLRDIFKAFAEQGYFTTFKGDRIYKEDFKGVYVAGSTAPLIWDFDNLVNHPQLRLTDEDGDHIYEVTLVLNRAEDRQQPAARWKLSKDIAGFPQYRSAYPLSDALYNLSLEEMCRAVEPDSTFRTGKEWAGVWTRDVSYSTILSMAYMEPAVAMKSLLRKVNGKGRIIQDTGTGGAYPCSTDRMIWAVAAWEIYLATGDEDWLRTAYRVIKNSMEDDDHVIYDRVTGLVRGESSFLDWREQTYPRWMQPADIFQSECLGTNAVHFRANLVLSKMARLVKDDVTAQKRAAVAEQIRRGINRYLWLPDKGYYAQYLYGRVHRIVSPRWEALGEALCILWDIAGAHRCKEIIRRAPMTPFGIPCIYPEIPDIPPYHNNAVWPFVESFWTLAAAKAGNEQAVMKGIGDIYRPAAMFLTNKENFEADNGDYAGTQINSSNMLWSLSGSIGLVHRLLFGLRWDERGLAFAPFVPRAMRGVRTLKDFGYRNAVLDITLEGYGNKVADLRLDGKMMPGRRIDKGLTGRHTVYIRLAGGVAAGPMGRGETSGASGPTSMSGNSGPIGGSGKSEPIEVSGESGPIGGSGKSEPIEDSGKSGPTEVSGKSGPIGGSGKSGPTSMSGKSEPIEDSGKSGRTSMSGKSEPIEVSGKSGPIKVSGRSEPIEGSGKSGPIGGSGKSEPIEVSGKSGPVEVSGKSGPGRVSGTFAMGLPVYFSLPTPELSFDKGELSWHAVKGAVRYKLLKDGRLAAVTRSTRMRVAGGDVQRGDVRRDGVQGASARRDGVRADDVPAEWQVIALDTAGVESFASEPLVAGEEKVSLVYQAEEMASPASYDYKGFTGKGFIEVSKAINRVVRFPVELAEEGEYVIDLRYANGNGPTNTENKCAIRTLVVDDSVQGTIVLPQRGKGEWSNWGYSNPLSVRLAKGRHYIELKLEDFDENMNGDINQAMIDCLRVRRVEPVQVQDRLGNGAVRGSS